MKDSNWYEKKGDELAESIFSRVGQIEESQDVRRNKADTYLKLYGNFNDFEIGINELPIDTTDPFAGLTLNVCQIIIDTVTSKIATNQPRPFFLTEKGNWEKQEQAKKLNKFIYGQFYQSQTYEKSLKAFLCACVFDSGFLKHYLKDGKICTDWVLPTEILADKVDSLYGSPRSLFQTRLISKSVLVEKYPKLKEHLETIHDELRIDYGSVSDKVKVVEAWHLKSGDNAKDGVHALCVKGKIIMEEKYEDSDFPFSKYSIFDNILGFYGKGIVESLAPIQMEINKTIKKIQQAIHISSVARVFLERGAKVNDDELTNEDGSIVYYTGKMPIFDVARAVSPESANHLENLFRKAFEIIGVSQLTASSKKPSGLNSGKAIREYNDIETERFARIAKQWENFHLDIAKKYITLAKKAAENDHDVYVLAHDKEGIEKIKWKDVCLPEDSYIMQLYPTSMLPKTPAGRLEYAQELLTAGFISPEEGLELLDFPDIESVTNFKNASYLMAKKIINTFTKGNFVEPDTYHPNAQILPFIQNALVHFETQGMDEVKLDLFRLWIDQAMLLINPPEQQLTQMEGEVDALNEEEMIQANAQAEQVDTTSQII